MKNVAPLLLAGTVLGSQATIAATVSDCLEVANEINKSVPMQIDMVTSVFNAACYQDGPAVVLVYRAMVSVDRTLTQKDISSLKPQATNFLCTDPDAKVLIDHFFVEYSYTDKNRKFIGRNRISKKDCGKAR